MIAERSLGAREKIAAIVCDPALVAASDALEVHDYRNGGRPRHHGKYAHVLVHVIIKTVYGGRVRRIEGEISNPEAWAWLRELVARTYPQRPDVWLPAIPLRRHHYLQFRDAYLTGDQGMTALGENLTNQGVRLARRLGLCDPNGRGSLTHPHSSRCFEADGKVIRPHSHWGPSDRIVDASTGVSRPRRHDPDAEPYGQGGKRELVMGHKTEVLSTRGDGWYQRAILAADLVPEGGELVALHAMLTRVAPELPGAQVLNYDGAARGIHHNSFMSQHGILGISPPNAKRVDPVDRRVRIEHRVPYGTLNARSAVGSDVPVELWTEGGQLCEADHNERGDVVLSPVELQQVIRRAGKWGFRFYGRYQTATGAEFSVPFHETAADRQRKFNRCEHLRPFPPGSQQYKTLYGRRSDTESINRQIEDALWQKRANVYGRKRVLVDLIGWAMGQNAIARYLYNDSVSDHSAAAVA